MGTESKLSDTNQYEAAMAGDLGVGRERGAAGRSGSASLGHAHDTGGRRWAHGLADSICALSDTSVASSHGRPTS